jgi:hypothetical protein
VQNHSLVALSKALEAKNWLKNVMCIVRLVVWISFRFRIYTFNKFVQSNDTCCICFRKRKFWNNAIQPNVIKHISFVSSCYTNMWLPKPVNIRILLLYDRFMEIFTLVIKNKGHFKWCKLNLQMNLLLSQ